MSKSTSEPLSTKERLLKLALKAYAEKGAHNTNFQSLANELGISQAAIYKHFRTKDELMTSAIRYAADKGQAFIVQVNTENISALEKLRKQLERNLLFCTENRENAIALLVMHYYASSIPEIKKLHEEINERRTQRILETLFLAKNEGKIKGTQLPTKADQIHSLLLGEMVKTYLWPTEKSTEVRLQALWRTVQAILN